MSNIRLWKASDEYYQLCEQLYNSTDEDGVVNAEVFENMIVARETFEAKAIACAMVYRQLEKDIADVNIELNRLKELKDSLSKKKQRLADSLSDACVKTGIDSIKGVYANISFRASEETIIDDESQIPYDFINEKITYLPDKAKIKAAIKSGQVVSGAHVESKKNIQIK